jgi:hypothetical protein
MTTLWVREYSDMPATGDVKGHGIPVAGEPGTDQTVSFTTSTASAAFAATTRYIGIIGSGAFHYVVAASPTATTGALKVPANTLLYVGVTPGHKIAAIDAA